jgi:uridine phosphorylase
LNGVEVSVIQTHVGSSGTATVMEMLRNSECKAAIRIDWCGAVRATGPPDNPTETGIEVGSVVVPKRVFLTDGTSNQYLQMYAGQVSTNPLFRAHPVLGAEGRAYPNQGGTYWSTESNENLYDLFTQGLTGHNARGQEDAVWSSDALFCESPEAVDTWKLYGCTAVDMESAAVYLLGALFGIPAISVLGVSNINDSEEYALTKSKKMHPGVLEGMAAAVQLLASTLPKLQGALDAGEVAS